METCEPGWLRKSNEVCRIALHIASLHWPINHHGAPPSSSGTGFAGKSVNSRLRSCPSREVAMRGFPRSGRSRPVSRFPKPLPACVGSGFRFLGRGAPANWPSAAPAAMGRANQNFPE